MTMASSSAMADATVQPLLAMLASFGLPRSEALAVASKAMQERLLQLLPSLPTERLQELLAEAAPHIASASLQPLVFRLIELSPELPADLMQRLESDDALMRSMPVATCRRILSSHENIFMKKCMSLVDAICQEYASAEGLLEGTEGGRQRLPPKTRRLQCAPLQQLVSLMPSTRMYGRLIYMLHSFFEGTCGDHRIAAVRCDVTMAPRQLKSPRLPHMAPWRLPRAAPPMRHLVDMPSSSGRRCTRRSGRAARRRR